MTEENKKGWQYFLAIIGTPTFACIVYLLVAQYMCFMLYCDDDWFVPIIISVFVVCEIIAVGSLYILARLLRFFDGNWLAKCIITIICLAMSIEHAIALWNYNNEYGVRLLNHDTHSFVIYITACVMHLTLIGGIAAKILLDLMRNIHKPRIRITLPHCIRMTIIYIIMCIASIALVRCASIAIALSHPKLVAHRHVYIDTDGSHYHIYNNCGYYDYYEKQYHTTINDAEHNYKFCRCCVVRAAYHKYDTEMYIILLPLFFSCAFSIFNKRRTSTTI